jgi:hypothetical protein
MVKMKKLLVILTVVFLISVASFSYIYAARPDNRPYNDNTRGNQYGGGNFTNQVSDEDLDESSEAVENSTENTTEYTLEEMLVYAIEDEYKAYAEYEKIIDIYGDPRPFTNIIKAEQTHIEALEPLFEKYNFDLPENNAKEEVIVPNDLQEAMDIGVQAEIDNIAMYEKFLSQELPQDIEDTFNYLMNASENHLSAFQRGVRP